MSRQRTALLLPTELILAPPYCYLTTLAQSTSSNPLLEISVTSRPWAKIQRVFDLHPIVTWLNEEDEVNTTAVDVPRVI